MFAVVQEMNPSRSGASQRLKLQGKWYVANYQVNLDGVSKGQYVEYETSSFPGQDGKPIASIARIRPAPEQNGYGQSTQGGQNAANSRGSAQTGSTITDGDILRSVSNIVGNACAAGKIGDAQQIIEWVNMAHFAFMNMGKAQASGPDRPGSAPREPGSDDEPPPFDDSDDLRF